MNTVSIITGGGRGLGRAISQRLAVDTAVLLVGRTEQDLQLACRDIEAAGGNATYVVGDVREPETAERAITVAKDRGWMVQNLICNAGIGKSSPTETVSTQAWHDTLAINLDGSFWFVRACLPLMKQQQSGTICLMSSIAGVKGFAYEAAYTASKHALTGLAKTVALEYGKHGITCVSLCPNFVEGEMTNRTIHGLAKRRNITVGKARVIIEELNPERRIIPAEEVAETVARLCSGALKTANGQPVVMGDTI
jgi:NAD(P)-dependent dehydrogenase (short-subunit alcohol dehydrogenase family)